MADDITFLRLPDVSRRVGLRKTKIYALIKAGDFPAPRHEGKVSYWPDVEITAWQRARMAA
jgi:prophage regulatory protein